MNQLIQFYSNNATNLRHLTIRTVYDSVPPRNGDRIAAITDM